MATDQVTGESKGYGFVTMTDDAGAERAIHGTRIGGRTITVRLADNEQPTSDAPAMRSPGAINHNREKENVGHTEIPRTKRPRLPI
jgi:RNA recognition motif-containing protein